jgi:hypothetical protein
MPNGPVVDEGGVPTIPGRAYLQGIDDLSRASLAKDGSEPLTGYTVLTLPDATELEGSLIYVSNEAGGKTLAFSDGTNWRRVQDRNVVS